MSKKKFYFIVFEGIEGTGKSYQINKLYKILPEQSLKLKKQENPEVVSQLKK